jgi:CP family cyanate transporter-like MFS transporter
VSVPLESVLPGGWRGSLASWAAPTLLAILVWIPHVARPHPTATRTPGGELAAPIPWRSPLAWQIAGFMGVQSTMFFVAIAWYPAYLRDHGFDAAATGWMLTLYQVAALLAGLAIPALIRRHRDQRGLAASLAAIGAIATLGLLLWPAGAVGWMVLLGIGAGPSLILALSFMGLRAGDSRTAAALSLMAQSVGYFVATFGPLAFGAIHDLTGGWTTALLAMIGLASIKAILGLGAGRRLAIP